jgi:hypothetical protein
MSTLSLFADVCSQKFCIIEPFVKECFTGSDRPTFQECVDKESICEISDALNCGKEECVGPEKCCRHKNDINNVRCQSNCEADYYEDTSKCGLINCNLGEVCCQNKVYEGKCVSTIAECKNGFKYLKTITKDTSNPIPNKRKRKFKKF